MQENEERRYRTTSMPEILFCIVKKIPYETFVDNSKFKVFIFEQAPIFDETITISISDLKRAYYEVRDLIKYRSA